MLQLRFAALASALQRLRRTPNPWSEMLANVAKRVGGSENALLRKHDEVKNVLVVVVVSDRGLAGGFNSNVLRHVDRS